MANIGPIISILALALSTIGLLYTVRRNSGADSRKIWDAIGSSNTEIALLKKQGDLFWGLIEQQMAKALIRPTHIELDRLLEKVVRNEELIPAQENRLVEMLKEIVHDKQEVAGVRAMGATILAIRLAKQEASKIKEPDKPCD